MSSKSIGNGISQIENSLKRRDASEADRSWRDIRKKIDCILISTNLHKGDKLKSLCMALDGLNMEDRLAHVETNWGPNYKDKVFSLIQQLESIESQER